MIPHRASRTHRSTLRRGLFLLLFLLSASASAETVYKCTDRSGHVSYQDTPCTDTRKQQTLNLPTPPPAVNMPAPPPPETSALPPPVRIETAPAPAPARIPQLYSCMRATDGKVYVSRNGHPAAYRAPLGMLGAFQMPLSSTYGGKGAEKRAASDPQLAHGRITPGLIGSHYTWVQDRCRPMSVYEICQTLSSQLDEVEKKIHKAFKSDQPPLERQAAGLRKDMAGCNQ